MCRILLLSTRAALVLAVFATVSCRDAKISVYRVAKEKATVTDTNPAPVATLPVPRSSAGGSMADTPVATATGAELGWQAAPSWRVKPAGAMRKGSYAVGDSSGDVADLSITAFPGGVGGESANVNRWRGQLQLPPLGESELSASLTRLERNGLKITLVDLLTVGAPHTRMLGAIVPFGGATWFFKLLGPDAVVSAERKAFLEFLNTIQPASAPTTP